MRDDVRTLSIHLTDLCNERCVFCVVGIPERTADSTVPEDMRRLIVDNRDRGFEVVNLHGGEPTAHPGFLATLELIRECGYREVYLQTNGITLARPGFVERLIGLNVTTFIVSMHGMEETVHDGLVRRRGGWKRTLRGIAAVKAAGGVVRTNTVIVRQNMASLPDMVDWLLDHEVDHVNLSNLHPAGTAYRNFEAIVPTVADLRRWVPPAVERGVARRAPVTLEGFPRCILPELRDNYLGDRSGLISMQIRGNWIADYTRFMNVVCRVRGEVCSRCPEAERCGGVYREYVALRGWQEFEALQTPPLRAVAGA